jgi:hypothetical protein
MFRKKSESEIEKQADIFSYKCLDELTKINFIDMDKRDSVREYLTKILKDFAEDTLSKSIELAEIDAMKNAADNGMYFSKTFTPVTT